jgi:hypothetical protein
VRRYLNQSRAKRKPEPQPLTIGLPRIYAMQCNRSLTGRAANHMSHDSAWDQIIGGVMDAANDIGEMVSDWWESHHQDDEE